MSDDLSDESGRTLRVLVVDDEPTNRMILRGMLRRDGHEVLLAKNGIEAVETFQKERPDLILMDVMMPDMDGYEATRQIKADAQDGFVPVIFLTALTDEGALAECVSCGGDDFLAKPYSPTLLRAKIDAMNRIRELNENTLRQRDLLESHRDRLDREMEVGEAVLSSIIRSDELNIGNVNLSLSPLEVFSGDIFLAARRPAGVQHFLLGDFTGHGLSASLGAIPVAETFYGMTSKGFCIADIARTINGKLERLLPTGMYCAAALVELDVEKGAVWVWNGGVPELLVTDAEGNTVYRFESAHVPLGIMESEFFDDEVEMFSLARGHRLYVFSDGVAESRNSDGEMLETEGIEKMLAEIGGQGNVFERLTGAVGEFAEADLRTDDITIAEIICDPELLGDEANEQRRGSDQPPMNWRMGFEFDANVLRRYDPVPNILTQVMAIQSLDEFRQSLHLIFTELFSNALEHGILGLDSALKEKEDGFMLYYEERMQRLSALEDGRISVDLKNDVDGDDGVLRIEFKDSGKGFDLDAVHKVTAFDGARASGRGLALIRSLCESLEYYDGGCRAVAVFRWRRTSAFEALPQAA